MKNLDVEINIDGQELKKKLKIKDGVDGRNPLTVSKTPPKNPQKGDLWYKED